MLQVLPRPLSPWRVNDGQVWRQFGIESSDDLEKALRKRSQSTLVITAVQALLDGTASYVSLYAAQYFNSLGGLSGILAAVSYGIAFLYGFNAFFEIVTVVTILSSEDSLQIDAPALMRAVKQLAREDSLQLDVLGKAQRAISMVKIVRSLNEVSALMKQGGDASTMSSVERLAAFLALANAEKAGFDPAKYGLTEQQALGIAAKFARFDANDDGCLELSEIEALFQQMGTGFTEEEAKAALGVLDMNSTGVIDFEEFVKWYIDRIPEPLAESSTDEAE